LLTFIITIPLVSGLPLVMSLPPLAHPKPKAFLPLMFEHRRGGGSTSQHHIVMLVRHGHVVAEGW
jgi:hypothetical protein